MNLIVCFEAGSAGAWGVARSIEAVGGGETLPFYPLPWHAFVHRPAEERITASSPYIDFLTHYGKQTAKEIIEGVNELENPESHLSRLFMGATAQEKAQVTRALNSECWMLWDITKRDYLEGTSRPELIRLVLVLSRYFEDVLDKYKPRAIFDLATTSIVRALLSLIARKRGVSYRSLVHSCYEDQVFVTDYLKLLPDPDSHAQQSDLTAARQSLDEFRNKANILRPTEVRDENKTAIRSPFPYLYNVAVVAAYGFRLFMRRENRFLASVRASRGLKLALSPRLFKTAIASMKETLRRYIRAGREAKPSNNINDERRYFYMPLSYTSEGVDPLFSNGIIGDDTQLNLLRTYIPLDASLVVKDHRSMAGERPFREERAFSRLPGVDFLGISGSSGPQRDPKKLIQNSQGVIVVQGTSGLEAGIFQRPLLILGTPVYRKYLYHSMQFEDLGISTFFETPDKYVPDPELVDRYIDLCLSLGSNLNLDRLLEVQPGKLETVAEDLEKAARLLLYGKGI